MKYCQNCSMQDWCKVVIWFGSNPMKSIYDFVNENNIENCHCYNRKWWKFWIKQGWNI